MLGLKLNMLEKGATGPNALPEPIDFPDSKIHGANMGPTWVLLAPDGPHVGPMNLAIRVIDICTLRVKCLWDLNQDTKPFFAENGFENVVMFWCHMLNYELVSNWSCYTMPVHTPFPIDYPDSKVHGANMGPTWVLAAPDGPHVGPMNLAIKPCSHWLWAECFLLQFM